MIYSVLQFINLLSMLVVLQIPQGVPHPDDNEPLTLDTPFDIIFYVVIPILILGGFFFWRNRRNKRRRKEEDKNK